MQVDKKNIEKCIEEIEAKLRWGNSRHWTHQDFLNLSEKIMEETGASLSYITLKRIWGKVAYHSLPNTQTLDILARFIGYTSWRNFQSQHNKDKQTTNRSWSLNDGRWRLLRNLSGIAISTIFVWLIISSAKDQSALHPGDFYFTSEKTVSQGIPSSVIFDIRADQSPYDSVEVQQSWNRKLRTKIPKNQTKHTSIYYYPGFFEAKLVVGDQIVQEHSLHITTDGWYCAIAQDPVPVYFDPEEILKDGRMELTQKQVEASNIDLQPNPPLTRMGYATDFGSLKTDHFIFEAEVRNTYKKGSSICQQTRVFLLCEGAVIIIPLVAKGCESTTSLNFVNHYASGKKTDLSAFGVSFDNMIHLKIESINGKASIYINDQLAYSIPDAIKPVAIKGIDFRFQGLGAVDEVKLGRPGHNWIFADSFTKIN